MATWSIPPEVGLMGTSTRQPPGRVRCARPTTAGRRALIRWSGRAIITSLRGHLSRFRRMRTSCIRGGGISCGRRLERAPDQTQLSALRAGILSFASPKESSQRKGDPPVGAGQARFLTLLGRPGGCGTRATPSDSPRRKPPAHLRCSAPPKGPENRHLINLQPDYYLSRSAGKNAKHIFRTFIVDASPGPLEGAAQRRGWLKKGEDCLRAQPEFRSPRQTRVAQGTGTAPGSPSFCLRFLGEARKSKTPRKGGTPSQTKHD